MPLHLVAPGERVKPRHGKAYPNRYFLVRGDLGGREFEVSTKAANPVDAQRFKAELELKILDSRVPGPGTEVTFAPATAAYIAFKNPKAGDRRRLERLKSAMGDLYRRFSTRVWSRRPISSTRKERTNIRTDGSSSRRRRSYITQRTTNGASGFVSASSTKAPP